MRIGPFLITRTKATSQQLQAVDTTSNRGWLTIYESYSGAWQNSDPVTIENILTHPTVFACVTLIASDIAKMRLRLVEDIGQDVWQETESAAFSPVLRQPNHYQTSQQFFQQWMLSKLIHGNAYIVKERDQRGLVTALYVLDPTRVRPLVAPNGDVYYELKRDVLAGLQQDVSAIPASEVVHDRMDPLYHPLVGISPVQAAWLAAKQGLSIQNNTSQLHANGAVPGGIVTVPGNITDAQAAALKTTWESNYGGDNYGKVAVLAGGMDFKPINPVTASDGQVVEQLKWGDEKVCSVYHVPAYMVGVGPQPNYSNVEALNRQYYSQCLGEKVVAIENLLDVGMGLWPNRIDGKRLGVEFNRDDLWQMDTATLIASEDTAKQLKTPNESRRRLNLPPVEGGDTVYRQQQDYSIEALAKRDAQADPFASGSAGPAPTAPPPAGPADTPDPGDPEDMPMSSDAAAKAAGVGMRKELGLVA